MSYREIQHSIYEFKCDCCGKVIQARDFPADSWGRVVIERPKANPMVRPQLYFHACDECFENGVKLTPSQLRGD